MLIEHGVSGVVLGHSERRQYFGETDRAVAKKVAAALEAGLRRSSAWGRARRSASPATPSEACATRCNRASSTCQGAHRRGRDRLRADLGHRHGQVATAEQAQDAASFVRALVSSKPRGRGNW